MKIRNVLKRFLALTAAFCLLIPCTGTSFASSGNIDGTILKNSKKLAEQIEGEGIVLLKNDNEILPLAKGKNVNVFGYDAYEPKYGSTGSGSISSDNCVSFLSALTSAGIGYNEKLGSQYKSKKGELAVNKIDFTQALGYSDIAIVMIGRNGSEGIDLKADALKLSSDEKKLMDAVCAKFSHVIVLFNIANIMEMGFLDEYPSIEAAAIIWSTGEVGMTAVAKMLAGSIVPSGKLTDSVAYSVYDHPSTVNFGDFKYSNVSASFVEYEEGIYVGYRFFETFGVDVQYPFGYGLSYTSFDWKVMDTAFDGNNVRAKVKVTNTGKYAGKDIVQLYVSVPYIPGGVEKSSIQLASYVKTDELKPGKSGVYDLEFNLWDVSSYDMVNEEAWILDSGKYTMHISKDVKHSVYDWSIDLNEKRVKKYDDKSGTEIKNLFDTACYDGFSTLSRDDSESTMPSAPIKAICPIDISDMDVEYPDERTEVTEVPPIGVKYDETIYFQEVCANPALMDKFIDQLTLDEMISLICDCGYKTPAVDRLGITGTNDNDGPASVKGKGGLLYKASGVAWPATCCLAASWNDELAYKMGVQCGIEAADLGTNVWYSPAANIHRNPLGGRNFEYFSEDPLICGRMSKRIVEGAQSEDLTITVKHLVLNEQESNRFGILTWANEQTIREIYLRPFEKAIKEGNATGVMSAYNRLGKNWCGGNKALIIDLLRTEWGYEHYVISDFSMYGLQGAYMNPMQAVYAQNDSTLTGLYAVQQIGIPGDMKKEYNEHPAEFGTALRKCIRDILNMKMNSTAYHNVPLAAGTIRVEGETGKVVGTTNKGNSFVERAEGVSTGYVLANLSKKGNVITWTFEVPTAGKYDLSMILANTHLLGNDVTLSKEISMNVNGNIISVPAYKIKGNGALSFNNFAKYGAITIDLKKGTNTISWTVIGGDCPNVDYFDLKKR